MSSEGKVNSAKAPLCCSFRLVLALVGFVGFLDLYALRVNMSVAMVCMVNHTSLHISGSDGNESYLPAATDIVNNTGESSCVNRLGDKMMHDGEFSWNKDIQGFILSAFFWGYMVTQIPGGLLAERFGGKHVLGWSMFVCTVATLLTPWGASVSPYFLVVLRIIKGLGQGTVFPAMHCLWSKWAPPLERSKLIGFTYAGAQIGNVITMPISGILCDYGFAGGWPSIFYTLGIFSVVWFISWMVLVADTPEQHKYIRATEKNYITSSIGASAKPQKSSTKTPWKSIFTSMPVWAIIVAHTTANWGTYTMLTNIPTYMREVLKFNIKQNGGLSAIPYVAFWAFINIGGHIADNLRMRGWKTGLVRKISVCIGNIVPGIFMIATGFVSCENPFIAVGLLTVGIGFGGFQYSGQMVNHVDIAPPFAGTLFGISNTCATLSGVFAPLVVAALTPQGTQQQWQNVFYVSAAIYTSGAIFYGIFGEGEIQKWVKPYMYSEEEEGNEENEKL